MTDSPSIEANDSKAEQDIPDAERRRVWQCVLATVGKSYTTDHRVNQRFSVGGFSGPGLFPGPAGMREESGRGGSGQRSMLQSDRTGTWADFWL